MVMKEIKGFLISAVLVCLVLSSQSVAAGDEGGAAGKGAKSRSGSELFEFYDEALRLFKAVPVGGDITVGKEEMRNENYGRKIPAGPFSRDYTDKAAGDFSVRFDAPVGGESLVIGFTPGPWLDSWGLTRDFILHFQLKSSVDLKKGRLAVLDHHKKRAWYDLAGLRAEGNWQAVEAALRIKDVQEARITVLTLGVGLLPQVIKRPLAMGADELILLEDEAFDGGDSWSTAYALAMAIRKMGPYDLILCGRQAADWDNGQVGAGITELLGLPCVTLAKKIDIVDGKARVERVTPDGYEVIEVTLPAVITVTNEFGEARYPTIKGIRASKKIDPIAWKPADIEVDPSKIGAAGRRSKLLRLFQPVREDACEIIEGESEAEAGENLALRLREEKVL